ncbi:hypothetical protein BH10PSE1_BH10PSE1_18360 [soil metagenome]
MADADLTDLTASIVEAYVTGNRVEASALPGLIQTTHAALVALDRPQVEPGIQASNRDPPRSDGPSARPVSSASSTGKPIKV